MTSAEILSRYITFFIEQQHARIANSPLVLLNDPTTLFTSSGMQALIPYLLGEIHPDGKRLVNAQNCIRTQDIEEVGDNRHTTFFRMVGNWSLGDYFKKEQLTWFFTFLTDKEKGLGLNPQKLYVTVFAGDEKNNIPKDTESATIWKELYRSKGIEAKEVELLNEEQGGKLGMQDGRIFYYDVKKNWWSRSGVPDNMPSGEPGGPDSEVFYDFGTAHDKAFGEYCHPNCDCGRFMEIGNSVFMQYQKQEDGSFKELPQKNVDFGGGFERFAAAVNNDSDVFTSDLYKNIISEIEQSTSKSYSDASVTKLMRVIADHLKASVFLIKDGVTPSNKEQGYVLRRLLRRAAVKMYLLNAAKLDHSVFSKIIDAVISTERNINDNDFDQKNDYIHQTILTELEKFTQTLSKGFKEMEKNIDQLDHVAFDLFQTHGFPFEIIEELAKEKGKGVDKKTFQDALQKHKDLSRTQSAGKFKGGLADHSEKTIMGHTATHLLHQALRDVLGNHVHQTGSNITSERVRFDFNYENRLTDEQIEEIQKIVNKKIEENLPVHFELIPTSEAHTMGAIGLFMDTYGEKSKIYFIGDTSKNYKSAYSIEFCGGPHVDFTGVLKSFKIIKQENLGKNQKRLYAVVNFEK